MGVTLSAISYECERWASIAAMTPKAQVIAYGFNKLGFVNDPTGMIRKTQGNTVHVCDPIDEYYEWRWLSD